MREVDYGPSQARRAIENGENDEPREEEDENVGGPHARVREPFCVPVQIRGSHRLHIHLSFDFSSLSFSRFLSFSFPFLCIFGPFPSSSFFFKMTNLSLCIWDEGKD